jgi:hypothetical protein
MYESMFSCDPGTELRGNTVQAFLQSVMHPDFANILAKHGFADIDPDIWYPLQDVLNVMRDISQGSNATMSLVSIGIAAAENSAYPPEVEALPADQFFALYCDVYPTRHRGGDAGWVEFEKVSHDHLILRFQSPYPDDMLYGLVYGYARRFFGKGTHFSVMYDDEVLRRDQGGEVTVVHIYLD